MHKIISGYFFSPTRGKIDKNEVVLEIINYILAKPDKFYDIIVGCDSSSGQEPHFPIAIVVLRVGEGGKFFLKKIAYKERKFYSWKERILEEVMLSCQMALSLKESFDCQIGKKAGQLSYRLRYIHADVGENGQTRDMIKEVTGLIKGNGFEPKIKPESFVASSVADRFS